MHQWKALLHVQIVFSVSKIWARNESLFRAYYMLVGTIQTFHGNEIRTTAATTHLVWSFIAKPEVKPESMEAKPLQLTSKETVMHDDSLKSWKIWFASLTFTET